VSLEYPEMKKKEERGRRGAARLLERASAASSPSLYLSHFFYTMLLQYREYHFTVFQCAWKSRGTSKERSNRYSPNLATFQFSDNESSGADSSSSDRGWVTSVAVKTLPLPKTAAAATRRTTAAATTCQAAVILAEASVSFCLLKAMKTIPRDADKDSVNILDGFFAGEIEMENVSKADR
jgi:hypothetical protein